MTDPAWHEQDFTDALESPYAGVPARIDAPSGGRSRALFATIERLARTDVTVTLCGETGTGKDVLARRLHDQSARSRGPFVVFDCGAVAASLAESELLGHERGAFTGAIAAHMGAFERAHGGTLFLDEIGDLPLALQPRLLRALESRKVRRVGGTQDRPLDVRVVAATNRDLRLDVAAGTFRQDLFFRLAVALLAVPPLRERLDDLPVLVPRLLQDLGRGELKVDKASYRLLRMHLWPGNIRELKNLLGCAIAFIEGDILEPQHLRLVWQQAETQGSCSALERLPLAGHRLDEIERAAIAQTLKLASGNKTRAAQLLGIAVSTLYQKLKRYHLPAAEAASVPEVGRSVHAEKSVPKSRNLVARETGRVPFWDRHSLLAASADVGTHYACLPGDGRAGACA